MRKPEQRGAYSLKSSVKCLTYKTEEKFYHHLRVTMILLCLDCPITTQDVKIVCYQSPPTNFPQIRKKKSLKSNSTSLKILIQKRNQASPKLNSMGTYTEKPFSAKGTCSLRTRNIFATNKPEGCFPPIFNFFSVNWTLKM